MSDSPQPSFDFNVLEGYFAELLAKLDRIAVVMERFDNVMNPTFGLAEAELAEQAGSMESSPFPSIFLQPIQTVARPPAEQQVG